MGELTDSAGKCSGILLFPQFKKSHLCDAQPLRSLWKVDNEDVPIAKANLPQQFRKVLSALLCPPEPPQDTSISAESRENTENTDNTENTASKSHACNILRVTHFNPIFSGPPTRMLFSKSNQLNILRAEIEKTQCTYFSPAWFAAAIAPIRQTDETHCL